MDKTDFDRFVEEQQKLLQRPIDYRLLLQEWLQSINDLYEIVEGFLEEYKKEGKVQTSYSSIDINEEFLGIYQTRALTISIGNKQIKLVPVGRFIIGAMGRVDILGSLGRARLVRVFQSSKGIKVTVIVTPDAPIRTHEPSTPTDEPIVWKLASPPPNLYYIELTKDGFLTTLVEVSNG